MKKYYILMGDIISSSKYRGKALSTSFAKLVATCNTAVSSGILSPYTITLGDEFQGIAKSLQAAIEALFYFEELCLKRNLRYKLRYVLHYGNIDTPLNKKIAYGMVGAGLTRARELLNEKRRSRPRFTFALQDTLLTKQLNLLFRVLELLTAEWKKKDYTLICDMLEEDNNAVVGAKHGKNRSQIWKRRKHLRIEEYKNIKEVIFTLI